MTAYALDEAAEPDWVVIAQAEGILSARHRLTIAEATAALRDDARALGVPLDRLAEDLVGCAGAPWGAIGWGDLDLELDDEVALQEEMRRRRREPLDLDAATEALLGKLLR
jgi:hypothetical protein